MTCVEIKFYGAFVLNRRVVLHAIDATPARWRFHREYHTGAICISISAVLSLAIAVIHFRMPCWEAETKDPEWFY